ncbi:MAG TPA: hypothetical protein VK603_19970, partial [Candidatus Saccharimonadales bacterium]|nr:hypothetical protein [Candidatus Saccharimonadales bacterium]
QGLRWRMIEDGRQGMTVESLIKLCHETHVSLRWLLLGDEAQRFSPQAPPIEEIVRWLEEYLKSLPPEQRTKEMQKLYGILKEAERNDRFRKKTDPDVSTRRNRSAEKTAASGSPMVHGRGDEGNGRDKKRNGENGQ